MCDKPVSPVFWDYEEVAPHWDRIVLRSFIVENGERVPYQEGTVAGMLEPENLLERWDGGALVEGKLMLGGTPAALGGIRPAGRFEFEIEDREIGRSNI